MGKTLWQQITTCAMPGLPAARKKELMTHLCQNLIAMLQQSEMSVSYQRAFLECFDDNQPIVDSNLKTVGAYKKMIGGGGGFTPPHVDVPESIRILAEFAAASDGSTEKLTALEKIIDYALEHPKEDANGEPFFKFAEACCRNAFIGALNKKEDVGDYTFRTDYKPIMELAASFLPADYEFPAGAGKKLSLSLLTTLLELKIDSKLRSRADKVRRVFGGGGYIPPRPGYWRKVIGHMLGKVFPPFLIWLILTIIGRVAGGLAAPLRFFQLMAQIGMIFQIPLGLSEGCIKHDTRHPKFWKVILLQAYLLCIPVTFYKILEFCHALPLKVWAIVLFVIYGLIYLVLTIASLVIKDL